MVLCSVYCSTISLLFNIKDLNLQLNHEGKLSHFESYFIQYNIANPTTGQQKVLDIDDDKIK